LSVAAEPLPWFPPISLEALAERSAFLQRIDHKYIVPSAAVTELLARLAESHAVLEIDGLRRFTYRTVYFDSESLLTYRAHMQRRRRRFKCRTREYVETRQRYLEVKLKGPRGQTVKERIEVSSPLTETVPADDVRSFLRDCLSSHYGLDLEFDLLPALAMSYERTTVAAVDGSERVTIDSDLSYDGPNGVRARLAPGWVIVETKSASGRGVGNAYLRSLGIRSVGSCSKYCIGVALTRPHVRNNDALRLARRHFAT
jgi:hypothetical protein